VTTPPLLCAHARTQPPPPENGKLYLELPKFIPSSQALHLFPNSFLTWDLLLTISNDSFNKINNKITKFEESFC
jgi:hypothetical protein